MKEFPQRTPARVVCGYSATLAAVTVETLSLEASLGSDSPLALDRVLVYQILPNPGGGP
jgi:hypothetical protein